MILACLTTVLVGFTAGAESAAASPSSDAPAHAPSVVVRVDETGLRIENRGVEPRLLVFALAGGEPQVLVGLPASGRIESAFPRGAARGLFLEVVERAGAGWVRSGSHELLPASAAAPFELAFHASGVVLAGGASEPASVSLPGESLLPAATQRYVPLLFGEGGQGPTHPLHVPIPQPSDKPVGDKPPKLEKRPLPPV